MGMKICGLKISFTRVKRMVRSLRGTNQALASEVISRNRLNAQKAVSFIPERSWQNISSEVFSKRSSSGSGFLDSLKTLREHCMRYGTEIPEDVAESLAVIERKANVFATRMNRSVSRGIEPQNTWEYGTKFKKNNKAHFYRLENFLADLSSEAQLRCSVAPYENKALSDRLYSEWNMLNDIESSIRYNVFGRELFDSKIGKVSEELIHSGQTFYHGTGQGKAIKKRGFSLLPKPNQAAQASRELGEGVYLTPDRKVATRYAGLLGQVLHTDVKLKNVAAVNNAQTQDIISAIQREFRDSAINLNDPATMEQILKELFTRNGYNAAYSRNALGKSALFPDMRKVVDAISGGKQSQIVVFDTSDIKLLNKTFSQRVQNQKDQIAGFFTAPILVAKAVYKQSRNNFIY